MTFSELLGAILGWLGELIEWLIGWCPQYEIVRSDETGISQFLGRPGRELGPGVHWYIPNLSDVCKIYASRIVLEVDSLSLETHDEVPVQIGMVFSYHVVDAVKFITENRNAEDSLADFAEGALRDIVNEHTWAQLCEPTEEGRRLEQKLSRRLQGALERYGIEIETVRPSDQVRIQHAVRLFGIPE